MTALAIGTLPFFHRSHGAFTRANEQSIRSLVESAETTGVFDPFIGRGRGLYNALPPSTALFGVELLPAVYLLGYLDRPDVVSHAGDLYSEASAHLRDFADNDAPSSAGRFVDSWMTPAQEEMLRLLGDRLELGSLPHRWGRHRPQASLVVAAALVCSARLFTAWRTTKNAVWFKAGGIAVERSPLLCAQRFLDQWFDERGRLPFRRPARTDVVLADITDGPLRRLPRHVNTVATSPPYANGHNYARQWAPECAVAAALGFPTPSDRLIGVSTRHQRPTAEQLLDLPIHTQDQLADIRESKIVKDSSTYYFRRFASYAIGMKSALENIDRAITSDKARAMIILRDTSHGDTVFQSGALVESVMVQLGWSPLDHERQVIRAHIGNKQRSRARVVGKAQLEHTLQFTR